MRTRVTIRDVAKKAGVSISTVSRVLSPQVNDYMREGTRKKVLKAIKELDYRPDIRAQSLRGRGTRIVGLVMPDALNPFYQELAYVLEEVCYREKYGLLVCSSKNSITRELARKSSDGFTAVFCLNDLVALGAMRAVQEDSKNIPSDYSIVGFDNISLSSVSNPPLTTIAQPIKQIAQGAFRTIKRWKKQGLLKKEHRFWDTKLIVRESCRELVDN